jgi:hypothetical protein
MSARYISESTQWIFIKFGIQLVVYFNPLKSKLVKIVFKNSVRTAKKTQHFTITKINWLTLFKEIITVYFEKHTKPKNTK